VSNLPVGNVVELPKLARVLYGSHLPPERKRAIHNRPTFSPSKDKFQQTIIPLSSDQLHTIIQSFIQILIYAYHSLMLKSSVLGVLPTATVDKIHDHASYKSLLAVKDTRSTNLRLKSRLLAIICQAWEVLKDSELRVEFDGDGNGCTEQ
jgi:hypothetical protein